MSLYNKTKIFVHMYILHTWPLITSAIVLFILLSVMSALQRLFIFMISLVSAGVAPCRLFHWAITPPHLSANQMIILFLMEIPIVTQFRKLRLRNKAENMGNICRYRMNWQGLVNSTKRTKLNRTWIRNLIRTQEIAQKNRTHYNLLNHMSVNFFFLYLIMWESACIQQHILTLFLGLCSLIFLFSDVI